MNTAQLNAVKSIHFTTEVYLISSWYIFSIYFLYAF